MNGSSNNRRSRPARANYSFDANAFFARQPVFTPREFLDAYAAAGYSESSGLAALKRHVGAGALRNLRRGLYAVAEGELDPWAVASKLTPDAVLAYDGAATFYRLMPLKKSVTVISAERIRPFSFKGISWRGVAEKNARSAASVVAASSGPTSLFVTTRERTLVDLLHRPDLCPGFRAIWDAFLASGPLDPVELGRRALELRTNLTSARLGIYLEHLDPRYARLANFLERFRPKTTCYFFRPLRRDWEHVLIPRWKVVAPLDLMLLLERHKYGPSNPPA